MVKKITNFKKKGDHVIRIESDRLHLRTFVETDAKKLAELLQRNKYFWATYEPLHDAEFYTEEAQFRKILEGFIFSVQIANFPLGSLQKMRNN